MASYQRIYAQIDLDAIVENMRNMKAHIAPATKMLGVIKTDGYGHGSVPIAQTLEPLDFVYGFAVATAEEAHILRLSGVEKPVLILGYTFPYAYEELAREEIRPAVFRRDSLGPMNEAARRAGKPMKVHVKVDTGMGRIGVRPDEEGLSFIGELLAYEHLELEGIFTHFARADEYDKTNACRQLRIFQEFVEQAQSRFKICIPLRHCSNSAGIVELPQANMDLVRAGIALYGLYPSSEVDRNVVSLRPALSLYSHIVFCKTIFTGESVSYGGTYTAVRDTRVATIPVGYGDGYPRGLSNRGYVLIRGKKAPILGRVCMDQFMVDVTDIPEASEGDLVTLIGQDKGQSISAQLLGELSGRFHYELLCDLGKRVPRVYKRDGRIFGAKDYFEDFR
ncbi:MAG: alanine racemase [Roseburia sp.]|nr:alanine racemase [Roseburia sp.]